MRLDLPQVDSVSERRRCKGMLMKQRKAGDEVTRPAM